MRGHGLALFLGAGLLGGLVLLGGCSHDNSTGSGNPFTPDDQTIDLNAPYGGFLAVDEQPAFGDLTLQAETTENEQPADGYAGLSIQARERTRRLEDDHPDHYALIALWGDLRNGDTSTSIKGGRDAEPVAWDGSLSLSAGAIRLLGLIDFERPEDGILPRTLPTDIEWTSITHGDRDGLRVWLIVPHSAEPETLRFKAGDYEQTLLTSDLEDLSENIEISDSLQISLRAFRADPAVAASGFLRGHWGRAPGDSLGRFGGHWVLGDDGRVVGVMRGHYGLNDQNQQVFFGKYIDLAGHFRGFLSGTWEATVSGTEDTRNYRESGTFSGQWVDEKGRPLGELQGRWQRRGNHTGVFTGRWRGFRIES